MRRLPIGIEDFKELIDKEYYYVDKTMFIKDVYNEKVVLYTRPRRFGKTLNMSMLSYFFSIKEKENAYIFDNLRIIKDHEIKSHQNRYPVIFISLKDMKDIAFANQLDAFKGIISEYIGNNSELLNSEKLDSVDLETLARYRKGNVSKAELKKSLRFISQCLKKHYNEKVILLLDEYDVPLQNAYLNGYYEETADFLGGIFSAALKTNDALEKGVLTGCLRIAKESTPQAGFSLFTGLNNFKVNSIIDEVSRQRFGFTQSEIDLLLQAYHAEEYKAVVKEW